MKEKFSDYDLVKIEVSSRGKRLRKPVIVKVPRAERPGEKALNEYVIDAFSKKMPSLIPFTFENKTVLSIAKYLLRHKTGSHQTLYQYIYGVYRFTETISETPDELIKRCRNEEGSQDQKQTENVIQEIDNFIGDLQAENLAKGTISNYVKSVKALFRTNRLKLDLPFQSSKKVKYRDRAPTPDELQRIIEIANIREKTIISILALTGMRIGSLVNFSTGTL